MLLSEILLRFELLKVELSFSENESLTSDLMVYHVKSRQLTIHRRKKRLAWQGKVLFIGQTQLYGSNNLFACSFSPIHLEIHVASLLTA